MREDGVGRVLVASLHQSIADTMPTRLGFYENWLSAGGLREGTIGLAPLYAVLSFLRQEGAAYNVITMRAGEYAAEWMVESMPAVRRSIIRSMPVWLRARMLTRFMDELVRSSYAGSRAVGKVRRGTARIDLRASVFCTVREPVGHHLCGYYAAAYTRLLGLFNVQTATQVESCRGAGGPTCILTAPVNKSTRVSAARGVDPP
jgi:bacteriochlorophyll 4-vinyl reductase